MSMALTIRENGIMPENFSLRSTAGSPRVIKILLDTPGV
jgi:hypothetical protein